jgi:hypothetical protein
MQDDFKALLGIDGKVIRAMSGDWRCRIVNQPCRRADNDRIEYELEFVRTDDPVAVRHLHLDTFLTISVDLGAEKVVSWITAFWLAGDEAVGKHTCLPQQRRYRDERPVVVVDGSPVHVRLAEG